MLSYTGQGPCPGPAATAVPSEGFRISPPVPATGHKATVRDIVYSLAYILNKVAKMLP